MPRGRPGAPPLCGLTATAWAAFAWTNPTPTQLRLAHKTLAGQREPSLRELISVVDNATANGVTIDVETMARAIHARLVNR